MKRRKYDNLVGKKFNHLTVVERLQNRGEWLCRCECSKEIIVRGPDLVNGRVRSCRCKFRSHVSAKNTKPDNFAIKNCLYRSTRHSAWKRKYEFSLTLEQFSSIITMPCEYCGAPPARSPKSFYWWRLGVVIGDFAANGIDRVDNSKGYVPSNCVPCCETCNKSKHVLPLEIWRDWIKRVYAHQFPSTETITL